MKKKAMRILALTAALAIAVIGMSACGGGAAADAESNSIDKITDFTTVDINGGEVTQDVFAEADVTMINFWGTFCGPCVKEMPDLQKISEEYEGKAQVIGVPIDVLFEDKESDAFKRAETILDQTGVKFKTIEPAGGLLEYTKTVQAVPTTIFVDKEGNILGDPVMGANVKEYKSRIDNYLKQSA